VNAQGAEKIGAGGAYLGGNLDMAYRLAKGGHWWLAGDLGFQARYSPSGELRAVERSLSQWYRAAFGVKRLTASDLFDFRLKAEVFDYDSSQTVCVFGGDLAYARVLTPRLHAVTRAGLDYRAYARSEGHSGFYFHAGQYLRWYFGKDSHEFLIGGRFLGGAADWDSRSYTGWEASAGFRFKAGKKWEISPSVTWGMENYGGPATALEAQNRQDTRLRLGLDVLYRIHSGLSAELSYGYTNNDSNSALHDHTGHSISLGLIWNF
jgi:hypothetical protein